MLCYVAIGANEGPVQQTVEHALSCLSKIGSDFVHSKFYWTEPISPIPQPRYLNGCCRFLSTLSPFELLSSLQDIERKLGKVPKGRDEPRVIDLDLLFYGEELIFEKGLVVPHPRWHGRLFVLRPLADIAETLPFGIDVQKLLEQHDDHRLWTLCH